MTKAYEVSPTFPTYNGLDGRPLDAGYIYIGALGQNAETSPVPVFWDDAMTIPAAQPIRTIAGFPSRNGSPASIHTANRFSITVRDRNRVLVYASLDGTKGDGTPDLVTEIIRTVAGQQTYTLAMNISDAVIDVELNTASLAEGFHYTRSGNSITLTDPTIQGNDLLIIKGSLSADAQGASVVTFPGPFANDAAAAAAVPPVAIGGIYRVTGGALAWRQT